MIFGLDFFQFIQFNIEKIDSVLGDMIDRAHKRGDARTVAVLLYSAPAIEPERRIELVQWIGEQVDIIPDEVREKLMASSGLSANPATTNNNEGLSDSHEEAGAHLGGTAAEGDAEAPKKASSASVHPFLPGGGES